MNTKLKSLYLEDRRIKKMYANGNLLYQGLIKPYFSLSTDSIIVGETGETFSFSISANDSWTITKPENITLSSTSGYGDTTITGYATGDFTTGTINVTCNNQTLSITVNVGYENIPLTFEILSDGYINWMYNNNATIHNTIEYSKDNGATWSAITSTSTGVHINVVNGDVVQFRGNNATYSSSSARYGMFMNTTCDFNAKGNIMSLINSTNYTTVKSFSGTDNFRSLFLSCTTLKDVTNLVLPATGLTTRCYNFLFKDCTSLTTAPINLPATTLTQACYSSMFENCTSLTVAPDLLATTLVNNCYNIMFKNCSNLKNIKCMATSGINSNSSTANWVSGVSSSGTFTKKSGVTWPTGNNGIPSNWTVIQE